MVPKRHGLSEQHMIVLTEIAIAGRSYATEIALQLKNDRKKIGSMCRVMADRGLLVAERGVDEDGQKTFYTLSHEGDTVLNTWSKRFLDARLSREVQLELESPIVTRIEEKATEELSSILEKTDAKYFENSVSGFSLTMVGLVCVLIGTILILASILSLFVLGIDETNVGLSFAVFSLGIGLLGLWMFRLGIRLLSADHRQKSEGLLSPVVLLFGGMFFLVASLLSLTESRAHAYVQPAIFSAVAGISSIVYAWKRHNSTRTKKRKNRE